MKGKIEPMKKHISAAVLAALTVTLAGCANQPKTESTDEWKTETYDIAPAGEQLDEEAYISAIKTNFGEYSTSLSVISRGLDYFGNLETDDDYDAEEYAAAVVTAKEHLTKLAELKAPDEYADYQARINDAAERECQYVDCLERLNELSFTLPRDASEDDPQLKAVLDSMNVVVSHEDTLATVLLETLTYHDNKAESNSD